MARNVDDFLTETEHFNIDHTAIITRDGGGGGGGGDAFPIGAIVPFGAPVASIPSGYLACDGSEYDQTVEAALFAVVGTTWNTGGETPGFFRVPDLRAKSVSGINDGTLPAGADGGFTTRNLADTTGAETHTNTISTDGSHQHAGTPLVGGTISGSGLGNNVTLALDGAHDHGGTTGVGSSLGPTAFAAYIIKANNVGGGVGGVSGQVAAGPLQGPQPTLNFINGSNITVGVTENVGQNRLDITISSTVPTSGVQLIERRVINSATNNVSFTGLNGNADEIYFMQAHLALDGAFTDAIDLQPNGVSTGQTAGAHRHEGSVGPHNVTDYTTLRVMANYGATFATAGFTFTFYAKTNVVGDTGAVANRHYRANGFTSNSSFDYVGFWSDTSTNVTSLDLVTSSANNRIGVGSIFKLYKLPL